MHLFFFKKKILHKTVTFATSCWENDWRIILQGDYLLKKQIEPHGYPFEKRILIINNVKDPEKVAEAARKKINEGVLTDFFLSQEKADDILDFFSLQRYDFKAGPDAHLYLGVNDNWVYFNALAPLAAIYFCKTDYLLYLTGDSFLEEKVKWIQKAIEKMEKKSKCKVATLTWNFKYEEAKKEAYREDKNFYIAKEGFSDQFFLVRREEFQRPIYGHIREDSSHFPRGDVFEKRVYSYLKNRGYLRLIYKHGSYLHESI